MCRNVKIRNECVGNAYYRLAGSDAVTVTRENYLYLAASVVS